MYSLHFCSEGPFLYKLCVRDSFAAIFDWFYQYLFVFSHILVILIMLSGKVISIDSLKINPSLVMMRECNMLAFIVIHHVCEFVRKVALTAANQQKGCRRSLSDSRSNFVQRSKFIARDIWEDGRTD